MQKIDYSVLRNARKNKKSHLENKKLRSKLKTYIKTLTGLIETKKKEEASRFINEVYSLIDKAVKKNLIKKNNASNKKSKLKIKLNKLIKENSETSTKKAEPEPVGQPIVS